MVSQLEQEQQVLEGQTLEAAQTTDSSAPPTDATETAAQPAVAVATAAPASFTAPPPYIKKDVTHFTKKRRWKRWAFLLVLLAAVGGFVGWNYYKAKNTLPTAMTTPIIKGDLSNVVGLNGVVESANDAQVYSTQTGLVKSVSVQVGDYVEAGTTLAQLDTEDILMSITEKQAEMNLKVKRSEFQKDNAEKALTDEEVDIAAGLNSSLISAEASLDAAQRELNSARSEFNDVKDDHELADMMINGASKVRDRAADALATARKKQAEAGGEGANAAIDQEVKEKQEAFNTAHDEYLKVEREYGQDITSEGRRLRDARAAYEKALEQRNATKNSVQRGIEKLETDIASTALDSDLTLDKLQLQKLNKQLTDSVVTAPISGTVTAVYAKEGAPASGLMFIIEDTEQMKVKTAVREYDVNVIEVGMPVTIKSDATGEEVFEGKVERISPTSMKKATGEAVTDKVEYETEVSIEPGKKGLLVGMNVRLGVTTAEKKDVFSVPYDSLITTPEGKTVIYVAETNAEGLTFLKSIEVTPGLETDFNVEISGEGITNGMLLVTEASVPLADGVQIATPAAGDEAMPDGMTAAGGTAVAVAMG